jgi:hypothetical protein
MWNNLPIHKHTSFGLMIMRNLECQPSGANLAIILLLKTRAGCQQFSGSYSEEISYFHCKCLVGGIKKKSEKKYLVLNSFYIHF